MAKRKFLLAIGQSNSTAIGDAQSWEEQNLQIAVRNPQVNPTQYAEGSYSDTITLPYTFAGGVQTDRYGTGSKGAPWQTVSTKGLAAQAVKMLTFYDPLPAQAAVLGATSYKYPGTCTVSSGSTARQLQTTVEWQSDPSGIVLTRRLDGKQYTITSNAAGTACTVSPDIVPPPIAGEEFTYPFVGGATGTTSTVVFKHRVGAINDAGTYGLAVGGQILQAPPTGTTRHPARFELSNQPVRVGQAIKVRGFASEGIASFGSATVTVASNIIAVPATEIGLLANGDCVRFTGTALPSGLSSAYSYFIVNHNLVILDNVFQVATTRGGGAVNVGSTGTSVICTRSIVYGALNSPTSAFTGDYIVAKQAATITATVANYLGSNQLQVVCSGADVAANNGFANNDIVRLSASAYGLLAGVDYWVVVASSDASSQTIQFSSTPIYPAPTIVSVTNAPAATTLTVQNTGAQFYLRRPKTLALANAITGTSQHLTLDDGHYLSIGDTIKFSGTTLPTGISSTVVYTISAITNSASTQNGRVITIQAGTTPVNITNATFSSVTVTQVGGQELLSMHSSQPAMNIEKAYQTRGSFTGLQIQCLSGVNAGQTRACADCYYDATGKWNLEVSPPFTNATAAEDTYSITPPSLAGQQIPFGKFAMWLPWCPFEGMAEGKQPEQSLFSCAGPGLPITATCYSDILPAGTRATVYGIAGYEGANTSITASTSTVIRCGTNLTSDVSSKWIKFRTGALAGQARRVASSTTGANSTITVSTAFSAAPSNGDAFDVWTSELPFDLSIRQVVYLQPTSQFGTYTLYSSYSSSPLTGSSSYTNVAGWLVLEPQAGKRNPYPPGFNYPNHYTPVAGAYQPFQGPALGYTPKQGHYVGLALRMHEYSGEAMHVVALGFSGSGLAQREVTDLSALGQAWHDPDQQSSWAPGDPNNCYGRLVDVLDAANTAFAAQGDTGECVGIFWAQGEEDARYADRSARYYNNCTTLKRTIRQAIVDAGLASVSPHKIPWVHPKVRANILWPYSEIVNEAIDKMVDADSYSRTAETDDLPVMWDGIHYTGAGMNTLGQRMFEQWLSIQRMGTSEVEICNLALANIGETAKITSIEPPDGSAQAAICARFYPLARDTLLEMGNWSFAIKRKTLVEVDNPRTEWEYAYEVPGDVNAVLAVLPPGALDDWVMNGQLVPQKFVIETNVYGQKVLYTNQEDADIRYTAKIVDTTLFSNLFVMSLSWHLSSMIAGPLIKGDVGAAESKRCAQMATAYMMQAATYDKTTQAEIKPSHTPSWISIR